MRMRTILAAGALAALAACGADGPPERPWGEPSVGVSAGFGPGGPSWGGSLGTTFGTGGDGSLSLGLGF